MFGPNDKQCADLKKVYKTGQKYNSSCFSVWFSPFHKLSAKLAQNVHFFHCLTISGMERVWIVRLIPISRLNGKMIKFPKNPPTFKIETTNDDSCWDMASIESVLLSFWSSNKLIVAQPDDNPKDMVNKLPMIKLHSLIDKWLEKKQSNFKQLTAYYRQELLDDGRNFAHIVNDINKKTINEKHLLSRKIKLSSTLSLWTPLYLVLIDWNSCVWLTSILHIHY